MAKTIRIDQFLDDAGRITQFPQKHSVRYALLTYLATKFDVGVDYTERQVNEICGTWHTFGDYFMLRRALVDNGLLDRARNGSRYWRMAANPSEDDSANPQQTEESQATVQD